MMMTMTMKQAEDDSGLDAMLAMRLSIAILSSNTVPIRLGKSFSQHYYEMMMLRQQWSQL